MDYLEVILLKTMLAYQFLQDYYVAMCLLFSAIQHSMLASVNDYVIYRYTLSTLYLMGSLYSTVML